MQDENATSVGLVIGQAVRVCPGQRYRLSAQIFIIDDRPAGSTHQDLYAELYADELLIAAADNSYIREGRVGMDAWKLLRGEFAVGDGVEVVTVKVRFLAGSSYRVAQWGVDDVVLTSVGGGRALGYVVQ